MMGLRTSVYWLSWFVKNLIYLFLVILLYTIICFIDTENGRLFQHTEPSLFFVFLLLYVLATIAFSFMVSTFFKKGKMCCILIVFMLCSNFLYFFFNILLFINTYKMYLKHDVSSSRKPNNARLLTLVIIQPS